MTEVEQCPDNQRLRDLILGRVAPGDSEQFALHLETCPACATLMDRALQGDTVLEIMRAQGGRTEELPDAATEALVSRMIGLPRPARPSLDTPQDATSGLTPTVPMGLADVRDFLAPPQAPDELGRLGPYRVLEISGAGGMGIVFRAEDADLKRKVALKVMRSEVAKTALARERFLREAQAAAAIDHENVVAIHQVGEARTAGGVVPFLAMPWLRGMTLEDRLSRGGRAKPHEVARIGRQVALGLAAAHAGGLIHRDIKPANIWLEAAEGRVKILDFGLARGLGEDARLTQHGTILGTPAYMSPEQGRGDPVDPRSDLFSLGVVLYHLGTGVMPFRGETTMAILSSLALDRPEPPKRLNPAISADLSDLILRMLAKDAARRPASALEVAHLLQAVIDDRPLPTFDLGPTEEIVSPPAVPPTRGRRPVAVAAIALLSLAVAAAVFLFETPTGTIRVEVNDPEIEAVLTKTGAVIRKADPQHELRVAAGDYGLKVRRGDLEFETPAFLLRRGDTVALKVEFVPGKLRVERDGQPLGETATPPADDRDVATWVLAQGGRVTVDVGHERDIGPGAELPAGSWALVKINMAGNTRLSDIGLAKLAGSAHLQELFLSGSSVSDAGLRHLAGLTALRRLALDYTAVGDAGLKHLAGLTNLQDVTLYRSLVAGPGLKALAGCSGLRTLDLGGTPLGDAGLKELAGLVSLQSLPLHNSKVSDAGLRHLAGLTNLEYLRLDNNTHITDAGLKELAGLRGLRQLYLNGTRVTDAGLKHLAGLTALETLDFYGTGLTGAGLPDLAAAVRLRSLNLHDTRVTDAALAALAGRPALHELGLGGTPVGDAGLRHLAGLGGLRILKLGGSAATAAGIARLAEQLPACRITPRVRDGRLMTDDAVRVTGTPAEQAALRWLFAVGGSLTYRADTYRVARSPAQLPSGPWTLAGVELVGKRIDRAGLKLLAAFADLPSLDFREASFAEDDLALLASIKGLKGLSFAGTALTDAGLAHLAGLKQIEGLILNGTGVTDAGLTRLAGLPALHKLDLRDTAAGDQALAALASSKRLGLLGLAGTGVTDAGLRSLTAAGQLHHLNLEGTKVTDAGLKELTKMAGLNDLVVSGVGVTIQGVREFRAAKPRCAVRER